MLALTIKKSTLFQLMILLTLIFLVLEVFYIDRSISFEFESSITNLDSLLPTKNSNNP